MLCVSVALTSRRRAGPAADGTSARRTSWVDWEETVSIQHELRPNTSITAGYYRRQFYNQHYTRNRAVDPDRDYTPFTIVGPTHPNLPNGGGEVITVYNLNDD